MPETRKRKKSDKEPCDGNSKLMKARRLNSQCPLPSLPTEILHKVFTDLRRWDLQHARLTCRVLAAVGAEHFDEVRLLYEQSSLERLSEAAILPHLTRGITTLFYQGGLPPHANIRDWVGAERVGDMLDNDDIPRMAFLEPGRDDDALAFWESDIPKHTVTENELMFWPAYNGYKRVMAAQRLIHKNSLDILHLTTFFKHCPRLENITLSFASHQTRKFDNTKVFADLDKQALDISDDFGQANTTVHALCMALVNANKYVKRFNACKVSYLFLRRCSARTAVMKQAFSQLEAFRLALEWPSHYSAYEDDQGNRIDRGDDIRHDMYKVYEVGVLMELLSAMTKLSVLKLAFVEHKLTDGCMRAILRSCRWANLGEFGLSEARVSDDELAAFLIAHATSLRNLSLSRLFFSHGSWTTFFTKLAGQLPVLQDVKLRGYFYSYDAEFESEGALELDSMMLKPSQPHHSCITFALETYVRNGGPFPDLPKRKIPESNAPQEGAWVYPYDEYHRRQYDSTGNYMMSIEEEIDLWCEL